MPKKNTSDLGLGRQTAQPGFHDTSDERLFLFIFKKKIKISKIYVRFEKFQNYPRSPYGGAPGPRCNFFLQICNEVHGRKKMKGALSPPPSGDRWPPPTGATGGPVAPLPAGDRGAVAPPPSGDRAMPPYISSRPPFPPHLSPKNPPKIQKKREGRSPAGFRTCDMQVSTFSLCIFALVLLSNLI